MTMSSSGPHVPISRSLWILLINGKILEASIMTWWKNKLKKFDIYEYRSMEEVIVLKLLLELLQSIGI